MTVLLYLNTTGKLKNHIKKRTHQIFECTNDFPPENWRFLFRFFVSQSMRDFLSQHYFDGMYFLFLKLRSKRVASIFPLGRPIRTLFRTGRLVREEGRGQGTGNVHSMRGNWGLNISVNEKIQTLKRIDIIKKNRGSKTNSKPYSNLSHLYEYLWCASFHTTNTHTNDLNLKHGFELVLEPRLIFNDIDSCLMFEYFHSQKYYSPSVVNLNGLCSNQAPSGGPVGANDSTYVQELHQKRGRDWHYITCILHD